MNRIPRNIELVVPCNEMQAFQNNRQQALNALASFGVPPEQVTTFALRSPEIAFSAFIPSDTKLPPARTARVIVMNGATAAQSFALARNSDGVLLHVDVRYDHVAVLSHGISYGTVLVTNCSDKGEGEGRLFIINRRHEFCYKDMVVRARQNEDWARGNEEVLYEHFAGTSWAELEKLSNMQRLSVFSVLRGRDYYRNPTGQVVFV